MAHRWLTYPSEARLRGVCKTMAEALPARSLDDYVRAARRVFLTAVPFFGAAHVAWAVRSGAALDFQHTPESLYFCDAPLWPLKM